jgi:hypothetical protein
LPLPALSYVLFSFFDGVETTIGQAEARQVVAATSPTEAIAGDVAAAEGDAARAVRWIVACLLKPEAARDALRHAALIQRCAGRVRLAFCNCVRASARVP